MTDALHTYDPGPDGRCTSGWYNARNEWIECRSSQRSSVLHDDCESDFRQRHDHGGGDCMCFEDDRGPSYHEVMRRTCYPTPAEIEEERLAMIRRSRRTRRIIALNNGRVIARLGQSLTATTPEPEVRRIFDRAKKLQGWGVRA